MNALKKFEPTAYAALRIVFGFLYACDGPGKILASGEARPHAVLDWTGAGIELVGGVYPAGLTTYRGIYLQRRNGGGLFQGPSAAWFFPYREPWRTGSDLLLCWAIHRLPGRRQVGRGQRLIDA